MTPEPAPARRMRVRGREELLHVEFETDPKGAQLPRRVAEYGMKFHFQHRLPVRSVVILLSSPGRMLNHYRVTAGGTQLLYRFEVVHLYKQLASEMAHDPVLAPFCLLGKKPSKKIGRVHV